MDFFIGVLEGVLLGLLIYNIVGIITDTIFGD